MLVERQHFAQFTADPKFIFFFNFIFNFSFQRWSGSHRSVLRPQYFNRTVKKWRCGRRFPDCEAAESWETCHGPDKGVLFFFVRYSRQLKNRHRRGQLAFISRLEFNFALYLHGCESGQSITYVIGYKFCFETIESTIWTNQDLCQIDQKGLIGTGMAEQSIWGFSSNLKVHLWMYCWPSDFHSFRINMSLFTLLSVSI